MRIRAALLGLALAALPRAALAHPHVWIDASSEMAFDGQGRLAEIRHTWTFDRAFSAYATLNLDSRRDGVPDPDKLAELARRNVAALQPLGYYTHDKADGNRLSFGTATGAAMTFAEGRLTLTFSLPVLDPPRAPREVTQEVQDDSFFVAFTLKPEPLRLSGAPAGCRVEVRRPDKVIEVGVQVVPDSAAARDPSAAAGALVSFGAGVTVRCP